MVAAADTFRAGAVEQLGVWAERVGAEFVRGQHGGDPAAVAFDAIEAAESRGTDVLLIDTAGRLHTNRGLMEQLKKIDRVVRRRLEGAPHETLLVLDATVGQNAVRQLQAFREALDVTGIVLAKLDSSARGGIVVSIQEEFGIPVKLVGVGEGLDDLETLDPESFVEGVFAAGP
jgi:fused signal recognition particle receptor